MRMEFFHNGRRVYQDPNKHRFLRVIEAGPEKLMTLVLTFSSKNYYRDLPLELMLVVFFSLLRSQRKKRGEEREGGKRGKEIVLKIFSNSHTLVTPKLLSISSSLPPKSDNIYERFFVCVVEVSLPEKGLSLAIKSEFSPVNVKV